MKVTICKTCGLTMSTGVQACRRCKNNQLEHRNIDCEDTYRLHKRVSELTSEHRKDSPYSSPMLSALLVLSVSSIGIGAYDFFKNPDGILAKQAQANLPDVASFIDQVDCQIEGQ